jgi:hypothetical protein
VFRAAGGALALTTHASVEKTRYMPEKSTLARADDPRPAGTARTPDGQRGGVRVWRVATSP